MTSKKYVPFVGLVEDYVGRSPWDFYSWGHIAFGIGSFIGSYIGGQLADRYGAKIVIIGSLILSGFLFISIQFAISFSGLFVLILIAALRFRLTLFDSRADRDFAYFLGAISALYLLFTWLWNPDYGGRKDWDLFAPSAFVYSLLAGYLLVRILPDRQRLVEGGLFIIVVSLLHTSAWIFINTRELPRD